MSLLGAYLGTCPYPSPEVIAIRSHGKEFVVPGREGETKTAHIFIIKNVEVSNVTREPKNVSVGVKTTIENSLVQYRREVAREVARLSFVRNDGAGEPIGGPIWNRDGWRRAHSKTDLAENLYNISRRTAEVFEVVGYKFASQFETFNAPTLSFSESSFYAVAANVGVQIWNLDGQEGQFGRSSATVGGIGSGLRNRNGILRNVDLTLASGPQSICRPPKEDCCDEQEACEQTDEKPLVFVHVADRGRYDAPNPAGDWMALIIIGWFLLPAGAIIWRIDLLFVTWLFATAVFAMLGLK